MVHVLKANNQFYLYYMELLYWRSSTEWHVPEPNDTLTLFQVSSTVASYSGGIGNYSCDIWQAGIPALTGHPSKLRQRSVLHNFNYYY